MSPQKKLQSSCDICGGGCSLRKNYLNLALKKLGALLNIAHSCVLSVHKNIEIQNQQHISLFRSNLIIAERVRKTKLLEVLNKIFKSPQCFSNDNPDSLFRA